MAIVGIIGVVALTGGFGGESAMTDVLATLGIALIHGDLPSAADCYQIPVMRNIVSH
ncbi:MAG: hypothetical protein HPM95_07690 [Alphaproteobacteria bacterium]|nr:hypothetical protein [Alphaproteobacteria bacterium]